MTIWSSTNYGGLQNEKIMYLVLLFYVCSRLDIWVAYFALFDNKREKGG